MQQPPIPVSRSAERRRRRRARSVPAFMVAMVAALALTGLSAAPALAAPATGTATGTFTVPAGTISPADVNVQLVSTGGNYADSVSASATSDTTGTYTFSGEVPGQYYVYFSDQTTGDNVQADYYGDGGTDDIQKAQLITIPAGSAATVGNETLTGGATISGSLSDANQSSESSAYVYADPVYTGATLDPEFYAYENVTGQSSYSLSGLPAGTYRIEYNVYGTSGSGVSYSFDVYVGSGGVTYDASNATEYPVAAGSNTTADLSVPALGAVTGTVSGPSGALSGDEVTAYDALDNAVESETSAGDGSYTLMLLPGTYKVNFGGLAPGNLAPTWFGGATEAQAAGVAVTAGATTPNVNVTLGAGGSISGTVSAAQGGATLGGIYVELLDAQGNTIDDTFSQPNGTYTLTNVPAGTWYLEFAGGIADNGSYYGTEFYGGTQSEFGSTALTTTAGQTVTGINGVMLPAGVAALGLPKTSSAALSGLHNNKVALRFNVAAGAGAGYLQTLTVGLPKHFSWNRARLARDLSLGAGVTFTDVITGGKLVVTLTNGEPAVRFSLKAGAIKVTKAIEKAAGGVIKKKTTKKKKKSLAMAAKAKKKRAPKRKDTIKTETINLSVTDTTGVVTSLPIVIKKPH